jgi:hypothetical protein
MDAKTYLKISGLNLVFVLFGVAVGMYIQSDRDARVVHAQDSFESVSPTITAGSMGVGTLLAGRIAGDQITSHGIDLLKLDENLMNYLGSRGIGTTAGWNGVVADSKVPKPLRMAEPQPPVVPSGKPDPKAESKKGDTKP